MEYMQSQAQKNSGLSAANMAVPSSVNSQADNALEGAARARYFAESLLGELRQMGKSSETGTVPCRSGIDGKLIDAAEHSSATLLALQEIRTYLLG